MSIRILLLISFHLSFLAIAPSVMGKVLHARDTRRRKGGNGTQRTLKPRKAHGTPNCPDELTTFVTLTDTLTFHYAVVLSEENPHLSILCGRLESLREAWLGFGISHDEKMIGSLAIIGLPDEGTVKKYHLKGKSTYLIKEMHIKQQTLIDESIVQEDGKTTMSFAKYLHEDGDGEVDILANGDNIFLYAEAVHNTWQYHGKRVGGFRLDLGVTSPE